MRLFVAAWPTTEIAGALSGLSRPAGTDLRWIPSTNWHTTLAFLGSVPEEELHELVTTLESIGPTTPMIEASVGPATSVLNGRILYVPIGGIDSLAYVVRVATVSFNRSSDREEPFLGHLTLARSRRGQPIPPEVIGVPMRLAWPIREVRLVSSTVGPHGVRYSPMLSVSLDG